jgi:hypothetical protein
LEKAVFLDELIEEIGGDEDKISKFFSYFCKWIKFFDELNELTEIQAVYGETHLLITDREKFLAALRKKLDQKLIKSEFLRVYFDSSKPKKENLPEKK